MSQVMRIYVADQGGSAMKPLKQAQLIAGQGIVGDRYFSQSGTFSKKSSIKPKQQVTLIEMEEIEHFNQSRYEPIDYGEFRRNLLTQGLRLNDLVGKEFRIGEVILKGIELCEPCAYLSKLLGPEIMSEMIHKCGLRAQIIQGGTIEIAEQIYL
jgi:MOSC domain-containing protein YiiM